VTHFRPYRNSDSPALAALWNRGAPGSAVARPLTVHEFDAHVVGGPLFEAQGLTVAVRDGKPVGYSHAGFGPEPEDLRGRPLRLSHTMGTVGMLVVEPGQDDPELDAGLLASAERYLRGRGASVVYAGGQSPLNPFYWGVYGGSEWAGILGSHATFLRAVTRAGYEPVSNTVLLEAELSAPELRDPRGVLLRRQTRIEVVEDALPATWWEALAVGDFRPTTYRLIAKAGETELAHASTWDMTWFGRRDGRARVGLIDLEVHPDHRRKGYGRHLLNEVLRLARAQATAALAVQTGSTNAPALALYQSLGFEPVETATLFRLPGGSPTRPS
jgi:ribosomal protein S18 acetylase RimI-like enzyme